MSYEINIKRNLYIDSENNQKQFGISNIKKQKNGNINPFLTMYCFTEEELQELNKIYNDDTNMIDGWLYNFTMDNIDFKEYVSKREYSNGNYEVIYIDYIPVSENIPDMIEEYIMQGGECPKCKDSYYNVIKDKYICKKCHFEGREEDFYK